MNKVGTNKLLKMSLSRVLPRTRFGLSTRSTEDPRAKVGLRDLKRVGLRSASTEAEVEDVEEAVLRDLEEKGKSEFDGQTLIFVFSLFTFCLTI